MGPWTLKVRNRNPKARAEDLRDVLKDRDFADAILGSHGQAQGVWYHHGLLDPKIPYLDPIRGRLRYPKGLIAHGRKAFWVGVGGLRLKFEC